MLEVDPAEEFLTLYRPCGWSELQEVKESGWARFPERFDWQPIFYPVLSEQYAREITEWNVREYGEGFVLRFQIPKYSLPRWPIQEAGGKHRQELWVRSEDLPYFNSRIVGPIVPIYSSYREGSAHVLELEAYLHPDQKLSEASYREWLDRLEHPTEE